MEEPNLLLFDCELRSSARVGSQDEEEAEAVNCQAEVSSSRKFGVIRTSPLSSSSIVGRIRWALRPKGYWYHIEIYVNCKRVRYLSLERSD
jgi:hypothetical protein